MPDKSGVPSPEVVESNRLRAIRGALLARARSARNNAATATDERAAAALRGKATAYVEAADMLAALLAGGFVKRKKWPTLYGSYDPIDYTGLFDYSEDNDA